MPDSQRGTVTMRMTDQFSELFTYGLRRRFVIEKHVTRGIGYAVGLRHVGSHGLGGRATVNEKQFAMRIQRLHQPGHITAGRGEQAAAMIINPADMGYGRDIARQRVEELGLWHISHEFAAMAVMRLLSECLHGQVQHDLFFIVVREFCQLDSMLTPRQKRHGHRTGQIYRTPAFRYLGTEVVDYQGDDRRAIGGRSGFRRADERRQAE